MGRFKTIEEARAYFSCDRFATDNGMTLDENHSVCSLTLSDRHRNAYGGVMGGVIFTLADFTFAVLSNHIHKPTVAQQVSVNYLAAPKGERLIARGSVKKTGRSSTIINVDVTDDTGREVLQFVGTGFKL